MNDLATIKTAKINLIFAETKEKKSNVYRTFSE